MADEATFRKDEKKEEELGQCASDIPHRRVVIKKMLPFWVFPLFNRNV